MDDVFHPAIQALLGGDLATLRALVQSDPYLATRRSSCGHPTLLQLVAAEAKHLPDAVGAARVLVEAGAPLGEPLVAAASVDAREVLRFLLGQGIDVDGDAPWTPLDEAIYWRHFALAAELRDRGAQVRSLRAAAGLGLIDVLEGFFAHGSLTAAAGPIRSPFADTVPESRANTPDDLIDNAFVMAVNNEQAPAAVRLLALGARVNGKPPGFHWRGTALHAAIWHGNPAMIDWLLDHGADPSVRDDTFHADGPGWAEHHGRPALAARLRSHAIRR